MLSRPLARDHASRRRDESARPRHHFWRVGHSGGAARLVPKRDGQERLFAIHAPGSYTSSSPAGSRTGAALGIAPGFGSAPRIVTTLVISRRLRSGHRPRRSEGGITRLDVQTTSIMSMPPEIQDRSDNSHQGVRCRGITPKPGQGRRRPAPPRPGARPNRRSRRSAYFREYVAGKGLYAIAEALTRDGILCPSAHDRHATATATASPGRNRPYERSCATPGTPAGRYGTANAATRSSSTSTTSPSATKPNNAGTTNATGSGQPTPSTNR